MKKLSTLFALGAALFITSCATQKPAACCGKDGKCCKEKAGACAKCGKCGADCKCCKDGKCAH